MSLADDLTLREVRPEDLAIFFEHQRDAEAARMAAFVPREREAFYSHWQDVVLFHTRNMARTVELEGEVVGHVVSWDQLDKRLVGYWIDRAHWGRGVATRAVSEFARAHDETRPLYAYVARENRGSIRVLEKCGFRQVRGLLMVGADGIEELVFRMS